MINNKIKRGYYFRDKLSGNMLEFILPPMIIIHPRIYPFGDIMDIQNMKENINKAKYAYKNMDKEVGKLLIMTDFMLYAG